MALPQRRTDIGPPHFKDYLPPVIQKNYGDWAHHEILSGGVMVHVANSGDKIWTVRVASPRLLSPEKSGRPGLQILRNFCAWRGNA
jgi:sulfite reductase beta subunit